MPLMTLQLARRPDTGRLALRVSLCSDEDATPREHEQQHRRLVQALLPAVSLDDGGVGGRVDVERERPAREPVLGCSGDDGGYEVIDIG
jgi:hypothetical protein